MTSARRVCPLMGLWFVVTIASFVHHKVSQLTFAGGQPKRMVVRARVALGPKFLKDLGLEKPDWLPAFGGDGSGDTVSDATASVAVSGPIGVGDNMPELKLPNQNGVDVSISSFKGGPFGFLSPPAKPVVLFFFAGSASPSCTKECQAFRDNYSKFKEKGAEVVGISLDGPEFNLKFKGTEELPFDLLSDEGGSIMQTLQIPKDVFGLLNGRQTYVIGEDGKVKKVFNSQFEPEKHVDEALAAL